MQLDSSEVINYHMNAALKWA